MSRIAKMPISIPAGVQVEIQNTTIKVSGPNGILSQSYNESDVAIKMKNNEINVSPLNSSSHCRAMSGTIRSLVFNMVLGVTNGFEKKLSLVGVGYKASNQGNLLNLTLGYSHNIYFQVPEEIKVSTETVKGKPPVINLNGIDKQLIGQIAAKLKSLRPVEPYKGKGVKFVGEYVRRKVGKTAAA